MSSLIYPVPSKRYDVFIKAFEKAVVESQKRIDTLRNFEREYIACQQILTGLDIQGADIRLHLTDFGPCIDAQVPKTFSVDRGFEPLVKAISERLYTDGLRSTSDMPSWYANYGCGIGYCWYSKSKEKGVRPCKTVLSIVLPIEGTLDYEVKTKEETYTTLNYIVTKRKTLGENSNDVR